MIIEQIMSTKATEENRLDKKLEKACAFQQSTMTQHFDIRHISSSMMSSYAENHQQKADDFQQSTMTQHFDTRHISSSMMSSYAEKCKRIQEREKKKAVSTLLSEKEPFQSDDELELCNTQET